MTESRDAKLSLFGGRIAGGGCGIGGERLRELRERDLQADRLLRGPHLLVERVKDPAHLVF
jgi:hypothetical protein